MRRYWCWVRSRVTDKATNHSEETALLTTTYTLLQTAKYVLPLNLLCVFLADNTSDTFVISAVSFGLTIGTFYLHIRLAFDAKIFKQLIAGLSADDFDVALSTLGLRQQTSPRTLSSRCLGAVRLWKALLLLTCFQALMVYV